MDEPGQRIFKAAPGYQGLETVSGWIHAQWAHLRPDRSLAQTRARIAERLAGTVVPSLHVVEVAGAPVATASLVECDLTTRPELGPWVASVYVTPRHRRRGHATRLLEHVVEHAMRGGIRELYLHTPDRQSLYARLGWHAVEALAYRGEVVTLMARTLAI